MKKYLGVLVEEDRLRELLIAVASVKTAEVASIKNAITDADAAAAGHRGRIAPSSRNQKDGGAQ
jgi:hypothetical protein